MPIHELTENLGVPIKGTIRLGVRKETARGTEYPDTTEYFVLTDAPDVEAYYGKEPTSLDICFPGDNLDAVLSTWYKYWSPSIKEGNTVKRGDLVCKGTGPFKNKEGNSVPGEATWYDRKRLPSSGIAAGLRPGGQLQRECWGKGCPDATDNKGNVKCKQTMQVFCILPLVSLGDIYVISTSSWESMRSFHRLLRWHHQAFGSAFVSQNPYRIYREARKIPFTDKQGNFKESKQYIMFLQGLNRESFELEHKDRLSVLKAQISRGSMTRYITPETVPELPMDELYPCIEAGKQGSASDLIPTSESLMNDPDVVEAFRILEEVTGEKLNDHKRLIGIRQREGSPDQKAAVIKAINDKISARAHIETPVTVNMVSDLAPSDLASELDLGDTSIPEEDLTASTPTGQIEMFNS